MKLKEFVDIYNGDFDVKGYGNEEHLLSNISSMDYCNGKLYRQFDNSCPHTRDFSHVRFRI